MPSTLKEGNSMTTGASREPAFSLFSLEISFVAEALNFVADSLRAREKGQEFRK